MPRGPDWLLGFGFQAKDRGLSKYLSNVTKQLEGLGSAMKDFQQINKQSERGGGAGGYGDRRAGADVERLSKQVGKSSSAMPEHSMGALAEEIDEIVSVVDKGLTRVKAETLDISFGLHKHIEKMFSEIKDGSITSAEALGALPNVLLKILLLSKDAIRSLKDLDKQVKAGKIEPKKLAKELARVQKQVMKAVEESSGYEPGKKKSDQLRSFFDTLMHGGENPWERTLKGIDANFDEFLEKIDKGGKIKKIRDSIKDTMNLSVGEMFSKLFSKSKTTSEDATESIKELAIVSKRRLKPVADLFNKRFAVPSTKLGRLFARVPLFNRLFGKKQQLVSTRRELAAVGDSVAEFTGLVTATEAAAKDSTESVAGLAEKMASAATEAVADPNNTEKIEASFKELVSKLHYDVAPLISDELAQLTNLFSHGRRSIVEETRQLDNEVSANFSNLIDHGINRLPKALDEALLASRQKLEGFGKFMNEWIAGDYSTGFTKFRERITRSARTFDKLREKASSAFTDILSEKELFVQKFEENFERLSSNVTNSVGKISIVTESEFNQMESKLSASYSQLEKISRMGVEQQADVIRKSFAQMSSFLAKQSGAVGAGGGGAQASMSSGDIVRAIRETGSKLLAAIKSLGVAGRGGQQSLLGMLGDIGSSTKVLPR